MTPPFKKASRAKTLERLSEVAASAVGEATALDRAFAAFDGPVADDPQKIREAQALVRALLLPDPPVTH